MRSLFSAEDLLSLFYKDLIFSVFSKSTITSVITKYVLILLCFMNHSFVISVLLLCDDDTLMALTHPSCTAQNMCSVKLSLIR